MEEMTLEQKQAIALAEARLKAKRKQESEEKDPLSAKNLAGAAIEPLLTLGTGGAASVLGGIAGLGAAANRYIGFDTGDPADVVKSVQESLTYTPKTSGGKVALDAITYLPQKYSEYMDEKGANAARDTGSPAYGAVTKGVAEVVPALLGAKYANPNGKSAVMPVLRDKAPSVASAIETPVVKAGESIGRGKQFLVNALESRFNPKVKDRMTGELATELAGDRYPQVVEALRNARSGETAAQAAVPAGAYEFGAIQRVGRKQMPSEYAAVDKAQQANRINELQGIGETPEKLAFMERIRKGVGDNFYEAARKGEFPESEVSSIVSKIDDVIAKNPGNQKLISELREARRGLVDKNGNIRVNAQEVLSTIDGLRLSMDSLRVPAVKGILNDLKKSITELSDKQKQADAIYRDMSRPITQMKVGQALEESISPRLGADERAAPFQNALANEKRVLKDSGAVQATLDEAMSPKQMESIKKVSSELNRDKELSVMETQGSPKLNKVVGESFDVPTVNLLHRVATVLNSILRRVEGKNTEAVLNRIAEANLDPKLMLRLMEAATPAEKALLQQHMKPSLIAAMAQSQNEVQQ